MPFTKAIEELDGDVLEEGDLNRDVLRANGAPDPETPQSQRRKERRTPVRGPERLAPEFQQVLESNQGMSSQLQSLSQRQHALPSQSSLHPCSALRQPISVSLGQPLNQPQAIAKTLGTPPRTVAPAHPGLLQSPSIPIFWSSNRRSCNRPSLPRPTLWHGQLWSRLRL